MPAKKKSARTPKAAPAKSGRAMVIVESPAKAKTINKFLGRGYVVKSCMGHVRDLPQKKFGIDLDHDFEPTWVPAKGKAKIIKELSEAAKGASLVYLAPDPDREGEAIAWHLVGALDLPKAKVRRVTFNEITKEAVLAAFQKPREIAMDLVNAQQARRLLDRIVGYKLSPLLWKKIGRGLSAGRVQSVAVRLIVDREREISAFKPREYWTMTASVSPAGSRETFSAELVEFQKRTLEEFRKRGAEPPLASEAEARALEAAVRGAPWSVERVEKTERVEKPPTPFTTSLLQQQGSTRLGFTTKRTMAIAQQLYEGVDVGDEGRVGLITYMRTDSFRIADEAQKACREFIGSSFGPRYVPDVPPKTKARKNAQEAHEAIRPTDVRRDPDRIQSALTPEQYRLYKLIWERFVASQMASARSDQTTIDLKAGEARFRALGRRMLFDGFTKVLTHRAAEDQLLPSVAEGSAIDLRELQTLQHFTEPPPRYSEAALVKALEKFGIGRPSTYAPIISTIMDRGYVRAADRRLTPTELGTLVNDKLVRHFDDILNTSFTAEMERELDLIEEAREPWVKVLRRFYEPFKHDLDVAAETMEQVKGQEPPVPVACEKCGKPMLVRWNRWGKFLGCSGFPECKNAQGLPDSDVQLEPCPKCRAPMTIRRQWWGLMSLCTKFKECKMSIPYEIRGRPVKVPPNYSEICPACGSPFSVKYGRRGPFIACTGWPNCKTTKNLPKEWFIEAAITP